eukprot:scaffold100664_cov96-Phaeocystis_antarctica.AAC.3
MEPFRLRWPLPLLEPVLTASRMGSAAGGPGMKYCCCAYSPSRSALPLSTQNVGPRTTLTRGVAEATPLNTGHHTRHTRPPSAASYASPRRSKRRRSKVRTRAGSCHGSRRQAA